MTRLPATDGDVRIGSLVLNPGGPGGSGVDLAWRYASLFPTDLLERFDLVGFDPRGVSRSTPVDCGDRNRSFRVVERDCVAKSGELLPYVGTQNAARDMEQLRKAFGDEQLTYLGFSYGTALGAVYANLFPDSVGALVLDGSVDPTAGEYTPGFLAPQMADALGDAMSVRWQGAGHTAFLHSDCVDQIVVDYLVDLTVPKNRSRCGFTDDVNTTVARAERVFEVNRDRFQVRLTDVFIAKGSSKDDAACLSAALVAEATDSQLVYAHLGVPQPECVRLRSRLEKRCE